MHRFDDGTADVDGEDRCVVSVVKSMFVRRLRGYGYFTEPCGLSVDHPVHVRVVP